MLYIKVEYTHVLLTIPFLGIFQREIHVHIHNNVHSSTIDDNLTLETSQMLINTRMEKQFVACSFKETLHNNENE